jgi:copper chaperone CopZ
MNASIDHASIPYARRAHTTRFSALLALTLLAAALVGCGSGARSGEVSASTASGAELDVPPEGITHTVSDDDRAFLQTKQPLEADRVTLFVNGLSCPLCASNVDSQLLALKGVSKVVVDLNRGQVDVAMNDPKPSPWALSNAIDRSGFTLVKIAQNP